MVVKNKRLQILDKPTTLKTKEEIDGFIRAVLVKTDGWFDPESLWEVENPYDVLNRMDELNLRVYTYKRKNVTPNLSIPCDIVEFIDNLIGVCQYNPENKDDNFLQDLYLSHWLNRQCYFSKLGPHNVCYISNNGKTIKVFPGEFIVKQGLDNYKISTISKENLENYFIKLH